MIEVLVENGATPPPQVDRKTKQKKVSGASKAPGQPGVSDRKKQNRYVLTVLKNNVWTPLTPEEMDVFEQENPDVAKYWKDPQELEQMELPKFPDNT